MSRRGEIREQYDGADLPLTRGVVRDLDDAHRRFYGNNRKAERAGVRRAQSEAVSGIEHEEVPVADVVDWEVRIVYQDSRLQEVKREAAERGVQVPLEWQLYEARRSFGTPPPPKGMQ